MPTATQVFNSNGGLLSFAARFSLAAYHLGSTEVVRSGVNIRNAAADSTFTSLSTSLQWLTATDLPSLAPQASGNADFPVTGIANGIYTSSNAAAIVARTSDALFIGFRGTNDTSGIGSVLFGTPDNNQWSTPENYYAKLAGLISALDSYVADPNHGITKVYVMGHSLGAAAVQSYLGAHAGSLYQGITFASIGTNLPGNLDIADSRQTNLWITNDIARLRFATEHEDRGDNNFASIGLGALDAANIHDMRGYAALSAFLDANSVTVSVLNGTTRDYDSILLNVTTYDTTKGVFTFGLGKDHLVGTNAAEILVGGANNDSLDGGAGGDYLSGGAGNDLLAGGLGVDYLRGGAGSDLFDFNRIAESGTTAATRDIIYDFKAGTVLLPGDRIDLFNIDAKTGGTSNDGFTFIGMTAFDKVQGELHEIASGANIVVEGDINGDGKADFSILIANVASLSLADFIL